MGDLDAGLTMPADLTAAHAQLLRDVARRNVEPLLVPIIESWGREQLTLFRT